MTPPLPDFVPSVVPSPLSTPGRDDRVLPATRWLALFLLPFLAVASALLFVWPGRTEQLFAWTIRPDMTAMMLSAAYIGGFYFFWRSWREAHWHHVQAGFPAVLVFAGLLGIATLMHWSRFHPGHVSFLAWVALYLSTPFLVLAVWVVNRRTDPGRQQRIEDWAATDELVLPKGWRALFLAVGLITLPVGLALFIWPGVVGPLWPWTLTPLTGQVVGALFTLPGMVGLMVARDRRWSAARTLVQAQLLAIGVILIAALRDWAAFDASSWASWGFVGGMATLFVLYSVMLFTLDAQRGERGSGRPVGPGSRPVPPTPGGPLGSVALQGPPADRERHERKST